MNSGLEAPNKQSWGFKNISRCEHKEKNNDYRVPKWWTIIQYSHCLYCFLSLCEFVTLYPPSPLQFRLVVKTALKLLLVFVEYSESNAPLLIEAITSVDTKRGIKSLTPHQLTRNVFSFIILLGCAVYCNCLVSCPGWYIGRGGWVESDKVIHAFICNGLISRLQAVVQYYGDLAWEGRSGHRAAGLRHDPHQ